MEAVAVLAAISAAFAAVAVLVRGPWRDRLRHTHLDDQGRCLVCGEPPTQRCRMTERESWHWLQGGVEGHP